MSSDETVRVIKILVVSKMQQNLSSCWTATAANDETKLLVVMVDSPSKLNDVLVEREGWYGRHIALQSAPLVISEYGWSLRSGHEPHDML